MQKSSKKILALILSVALLCTIFPLQVFAQAQDSDLEFLEAKVEKETVDLQTLEDEMQADIDAYFTADKLKYMPPFTDEVVDGDNVIFDFRFPFSGEIADEIEDFENKYKQDTDFFEISPEIDPEDSSQAGLYRHYNRTYLRRPWPGQDAVVVTITMTLEHIEEDISVSKSINLTIPALDQAEFMQTIRHQARLMADAKTNFFAALNSNPNRTANEDKDHIVNDLGTPNEIRYQDMSDPESSELQYIYKAKEEVGDGVSFAQFPEEEADGAYQIKSSVPSVLSHDLLMVNQPKFDTKVTLEAYFNTKWLAMYEDFFTAAPETYPSDEYAEEKELLDSLFNNHCELEVTVLGKEGAGQGGNVSGRFILAGTIADPEPTENPYRIWLDVPFEAEDGIDAWTLTEQVLTEYGYEYTTSPWGGGHLQKLTPPEEYSGQIELENGVTNGENSYWLWSYNDNIDQAADQYFVNEDDVIRWYFINDWMDMDIYNGHPEQYIPEAADSGNEIEIVEDADRPVDMTSWWSAFGGSMLHNSTKALDLYFDNGFDLEEVFTLQKEGGWFDFYSDPLQIEDWIYIVFSDSLYKLNYDGTVAAEAKLQYPIDSTARLAYADGIVMVPMKYGKVQAFTADSLTTVWIADAPEQLLIPDPDNPTVLVPHKHQSLTSLKAVDGVLYQGLCNVGWSPRSYGGVFRAISMEDGSTVWEYRSNETGFYWSGSALVNGSIIVGNDLGTIFAFNAADGSIVDKMTLPLAEDGQAPAIRTNMISIDDKVFFVSQQDGTINRLQINADGSFGKLERTKFSDVSTSSPTIVDGKIYVAGLNCFAIIDAETLEVEKTYDVEGYVQATPLVVKDKADNIYVYFTINNEPGAIYAITPTDDEVHLVYTPAEGQQNYCMASLSISPDGTLYYSNDSHTFFAVKIALTEEAPVDDDPEEPPIDDDPEEPPVDDDPEEPPIDDDPEKPPIDDDPEEPPIDDDPEEPPVDDDPEEPPVDDDPEEPPVDDNPEEPPIDDTPKTGESYIIMLPVTLIFLAAAAYALNVYRRKQIDK